MALLVMPIIIVSAQEALRTVPPSMREAAYAVGATRWQVIRFHVLPYAFGGCSRATSSPCHEPSARPPPDRDRARSPSSPSSPTPPTDDFTVMRSRSSTGSPTQSGFHEIAASGIIVLMLVLLVMNATAIIMRQRTRTDW